MSDLDEAKFYHKCIEAERNRYKEAFEDTYTSLWMLLVEVRNIHPCFLPSGLLQSAINAADGWADEFKPMENVKGDGGKSDRETLSQESAKTFREN